MLIQMYWLFIFLASSYSPSMQILLYIILSIEVNSKKWRYVTVESSEATHTARFSA